MTKYLSEFFVGVQVFKKVRDVLTLVAICLNGEIAQCNRANFTIELHDSGIFVVSEDFLNIQPYLSSGDAWFDDNVDKILRECHIYLSANNNINLHPSVGLGPTKHTHTQNSQSALKVLFLGYFN